jgi:hypothetical protein
MSLASSDVPKDDAPARKSATSKKDSTKSFPKLAFEEAFARTDGDDDDENLLLRAAGVKVARASAARLPPPPPPQPAEAQPVRLDGEEEHQRWRRGRRFALMSLLTFGENHKTRDKKKKKKKTKSGERERK